MAGRWRLLLLCVCVASLAGNLYLFLYLELKSAPRTAPTPVQPTSPRPHADSSVAASAVAPAAQTVRRQTAEEARAPAAETRPVKSFEECSRMRLEKNRAELRDPALRQQVKENYIASTRQEADSYGGPEELHLTEEQLKRLYELAAEWLVQSADTYPPPRSNWPLDQNPLIAAEFGGDVAQRWGKYLREADGRVRVRELAGVMATEDVPLTADQRRQLIELFTALEEERTREVQEKGVGPARTEAEAIDLHQGTRERNIQYNQKLMDRAALILSARQMEILRRDSEHRAKARELVWELERSEGKLVRIDANGCATW